MKRLLPLAVLCCLMLAPTARAGDFYLGAGLGQTSVDLRDELASYQLDDWGFKAYGGYKLFRYLGFEAAYTDSGKLDTTRDNVKVEAQARMFSGYALGILAFTPRMELFAKAGLTSWDAESTITEGGTPDKSDSSGTDLSWGLGFAYDFTEKIGVRLELEYYTFEDQDLRFGSVGVRYTF